MERLGRVALAEDLHTRAGHVRQAEVVDGELDRKRLDLTAALKHGDLPAAHAGVGASRNPHLHQDHADGVGRARRPGGR